MVGACAEGARSHLGPRGWRVFLVWAAHVGRSCSYGGRHKIDWVGKTSSPGESLFYSIGSPPCEAKEESDDENCSLWSLFQ